MEKLKFFLFDKKGTEGRFEFGESRSHLFDKYDQVSDLFDFGDLLKAQSILKEILKEDPEFIIAYHLLGVIEHENNNISKAKKLFLTGIEIAENLIPASFKGNIDWCEIDNRPYLRCLHGLGLVYMD